jgi:hypothetical protein
MQDAFQFAIQMIMERRKQKSQEALTEKEFNYRRDRATQSDKLAGEQGAARSDYYKALAERARTPDVPKPVVPPKWDEGRQGYIDKKTIDKSFEKPPKPAKVGPDPSIAKVAQHQKFLISGLDRLNKNISKNAEGKSKAGALGSLILGGKNQDLADAETELRGYLSEVESGTPLTTDKIVRATQLINGTAKKKTDNPTVAAPKGVEYPMAPPGAKEGDQVRSKKTGQMGVVKNGRVVPIG